MGDYGISDPLHLMVASSTGHFDSLPAVNLEKQSIEKSTTKIMYKKMDGKWVLTDQTA
jgi:hypothetical protein